MTDYRENILLGPSQASPTQPSFLRLRLPLHCLKWILTEATCPSHLRWPCRQYWVSAKSDTNYKTFGKQQAVLKLLNWLDSCFSFFSLAKRGPTVFRTHYAPHLLIRFDQRYYEMGKKAATTH